ncbi:MAG: hypothetical protein O2917_01100 [Acidobacteria bacterium]|nr:hypothetical protein [Acidobacteriota bacterium]
MATIEERLVVVEVRTRGLEGQMGETKRMVAAADADLKTTITALDARMEQRFDTLDRRFFWLIAVQFTTLFAIIAAAFGVITQLL